MFGLLTRARLLSGAGLVACLNGLAPRISWSLGKGLFTSLSETFGVSAIIWLAMAVIAGITLGAPHREPAPARARGADWALSGLVVVLSLVPAPALASALVVAVGVWMVLTGSEEPALRRAGLVFLALTLTLFWGPLALRVSPELLNADAHAVAWTLGGQVAGNIYTSVDGSAHFLVAPGCSSLNNMSLATVLAVALSQHFFLPIDRKIAAAVVLASAATIAVNIARMGMIARRPAQLDYWHHGTGAVMFSYLALLAICTIVGVAVDRRLAHATS